MCGPHLQFVAAEHEQAGGGDEGALAAAVAVLRAGHVLAVKGIGGYHLMCDARSEAAVARLRERKHRPDKPLAVMYPWRGHDGLDVVRDGFDLETAARKALLEPARSIVLVRSRARTGLASNIAPGLDEVGVFLPYSPLHQLLLDGFGGPLVATSGNVSGEPVLTSATAAQERLAQVADAFLHHDRPIARPADDSVVRVIAGRARPIRLGRGIAPLELELPRPVPRPVLAVGGHLKATVALAWDRRIVVSPHIGDMGTLRSEQVFAQVAADLQRLYDVRAEVVLSDAHPDYATTRWARTSGLVHRLVQHHRAHASALVTEQGRADAPAIVFAWDGVGLGDDGTLWGAKPFSARRDIGDVPHTCGRSVFPAATAPAAPVAQCGRRMLELVEIVHQHSRPHRPQRMGTARELAAIERGRPPVRRRCGHHPRRGRDELRGRGRCGSRPSAPRSGRVSAARSSAQSTTDDSTRLGAVGRSAVAAPRRLTADPADRAGAVHSALADGIVQVAERLRAQSGSSLWA